jgi:hypothetical protein
MSARSSERTAVRAHRPRAARLSTIRSGVSARLHMSARLHGVGDHRRVSSCPPRLSRKRNCTRLRAAEWMARGVDGTGPPGPSTVIQASTNPNCTCLRFRGPRPSWMAAVPIYRGTGTAPVCASGTGWNAAWMALGPPVPRPRHRPRPTPTAHVCASGGRDHREWQPSRSIEEPELHASARPGVDGTRRGLPWAPWFHDRDTVLKPQLHASAHPHDGTIAGAGLSPLSRRPRATHVCAAAASCSGACAGAASHLGVWTAATHLLG